MKLRIRWKKLFRIFVFGVIALVTILALVASWFSYQGRKEWVKTRDALIARGEKLSISELVPPPIPPEENFFADPIWNELVATVPHEELGGVGHRPELPYNKWQIEKLRAPLTEEELAVMEKEFPDFASRVAGKHLSEILSSFQKRKGEGPSFTPEEAKFILALLKTKEPILNRIELLAARPGANFPVPYEDGFRVGLNHISYINATALALRARATARLAVGENASALGDALLIFRLAKTVSSEPTLIAALVNWSVNSMALQVVKQGIPVWSSSELIRLEEALRPLDLPGQLTMGLRGERAGFNTVADELKRNANTFPALFQITSVENPKLDGAPWWWAVPSVVYIYAFGDGERAFLNQYMQDRIDAIEKALPRLVPSTELNALTTLTDLKQKPTWLYSHVMVAIWLPSVVSATEKFAYGQNEVNMTITACALQRCWLEAKALPNSLEELVPKYLEKIPIDVVSGDPLRYRKTGDETYLLWSVGANDTDENGVAGEKRNENDWVWNGKVTAN